MDYEKKYKRLYNFISDLYPFMSEYCKEKVEGFLPELCESEDEKIRKFLIKWIQDNYYHGTTEIPTKTLIAWLEKQGSEPNWCHHKVDLSNCSEEYRKAYYDGWNNCNQQHSQCKSDGNDIVKCLINGMKFYYEDNEEATWGTEKFSLKVKDILSWLEKQRGEMPADKIKPKFKVGDWVTNGLCAWRIDSIDEDMYYTNHCGIDCGGDIESIDEEYHIWTIQDAEDGDVLCDYHEAYDNPLIFILKKFECVYFGLTKPSDYSSYCFLTASDGQRFKEGTYHHEHNIRPATKEQRDLLFQKMHEAGYEWDAEKKGLRKIEQEPALSEEDEKMCESVIDVLVNNTMSGSEGDKVYSEEIDWLKSLRGRYTWKPSDEQMEALFVLLPTVSYGRNPAFSLYNDLKKLKGE